PAPIPFVSRATAAPPPCISTYHNAETSPRSALVTSRVTLLGSCGRVLLGITAYTRRPRHQARRAHVDVEHERARFRARIAQTFRPARLPRRFPPPDTRLGRSGPS